jgi:hypothetical protein
MKLKPLVGSGDKIALFTLPFVLVGLTPEHRLPVRPPRLRSF